MDTIYRKDKYRELIKKINSLQGAGVISDSADKYDIIQKEVNEIIENLRNRGDQSNARIHYILLCVPLALILIGHAIVFKTYLIDGLFLLLALAAIALSHLRMNRVIKLSQESKVKPSLTDSNPKEFILMKMLFLEKAIDIKKSRLLLVSLFYMIFFPIFLVRLHSLAISSIAFDSLNMAYVVAILVASSLWYFYFNRSFELYDQIESTLNFIKSRL